LASISQIKLPNGTTYDIITKVTLSTDNSGSTGINLLGTTSTASTINTVSKSSQLYYVPSTNTLWAPYVRGQGLLSTTDDYTICLASDSTKAWIFDDSGHLRNVSGNFITANDQGFYARDTSGTARTVGVLDSSNYYHYGTGAVSNNIYIGDASYTSTVYISSNSKGYVRCSGFCLTPQADKGTYLGHANYKWTSIYAGSATINTSDKNYKKDINELSKEDKYIALFDKLTPVSYKFIDGETGRTHIGFISQDVEQAMTEVGLTSLDFAGFCKDIKTKELEISPEIRDETGELIKSREVEIVNDLDEEGNIQYIYSLRYEEFIALNTKKIQILNNKIEELENKINILENKIKA
jgi:hypothetical protein